MSSAECCVYLGGMNRLSACRMFFFGCIVGKMAQGQLENTETRERKRERERERERERKGTPKTEVNIFDRAAHNDKAIIF